MDVAFPGHGHVPAGKRLFTQGECPLFFHDAGSLDPAPFQVGSPDAIGMDDHAAAFDPEHPDHRFVSVVERLEQ